MRNLRRKKVDIDSEKKVEYSKNEIDKERRYTEGEVVLHEKEESEFKVKMNGKN